MKYQEKGFCQKKEKCWREKTKRNESIIVIQKDSNIKIKIYYVF